MSTAICTGPLTRGDLDPCVRMHLDAFPAFFLSQLGARFLREFYRGFLDAPGGVAVVARDADGAVVGVAVGHVEPSGFFRKLVVRRWWAFCWASAALVFRKPSSAPRLLRALAYRGSVPLPVSGALLSSICVAPGTQAKGVGSSLLDEWSTVAAQLGAPSAYLTTDAVGNDRTNAFYESNGWQFSGAYTTREDRQMNCYTRVLEGMS